MITPSQSSSPVVSVDRYGATGNPSDDATPAFKAAFSAAGALAARPTTSGAPSTAIVKIPGGVHTLYGPISVPPGVDVVGEGWATRIEMVNPERFPVLVYGIPEAEMSPADRPDLLGTLDSSVASSLVHARGWSTRGGKTIQGQFTSLNLGGWDGSRRSYFEGQSEFVLDVCLVEPPEGWKPNTPILGCGRSCGVNDPQPYTLWMSPVPGLALLTVRTTSGRIVGIAAPLPSNTLVKMAWQIDFASGKAVVIANGKYVAPIIDGLAPGQSMAANCAWPFHLGRQGFAVATDPSPPTPLTLAGLRIGSKARYAFGNIGEPEARIDGGRINDRFRYIGEPGDSSTIAAITPYSYISEPYAEILAGDTLSEMAIVMGQGFRGGKPSRISDLSIWSRGPGILLGAVLDWRASNLRVQSETAAAIGSIPGVMSYPVTINDCTLSGGDAALSMSQALVALNDCKIEGGGRDCLRLRGGSLAAARLFAAFAAPQMKAFYRYEAGGEGDSISEFNRAVIDFEDRGVADTLFDIEAEHQYPTTAYLSRLSLANGCAPALAHLGGSPNVGLARAFIDPPPGSPPVTTSSGNWFCEVRGPVSSSQ